MLKLKITVVLSLLLLINSACDKNPVTPKQTGYKIKYTAETLDPCGFYYIDYLEPGNKVCTEIKFLTNRNWSYEFSSDSKIKLVVVAGTVWATYQTTVRIFVNNIQVASNSGNSFAGVSYDMNSAIIKNNPSLSLFEDSEASKIVNNFFQIHTVENN